MIITDIYKEHNFTKSIKQFSRLAGALSPVNQQDYTRAGIKQKTNTAHLCQK